MAETIQKQIAKGTVNSSFIKALANQNPGMFSVHATDYQSKYPLNHAHTSIGGHEVEFDNKGRLRMHHCKGPDIEVHSDGVATATSPADIQIVTKEELHLKHSNLKCATDKKAHFQNETTQIESAEKIMAAAPMVNLAGSDMISITGLEAAFMGVDSAVVSSGISSSITSMGSTEVCGSANVLIAGANVMCAALASFTLVCGGVVINVSPAGISMVSPAANAVIGGASKTVVGGASSSAVGGLRNEMSGLHKATAGSIVLN
jgi:hypothetical protein